MSKYKLKRHVSSSETVSKNTHEDSHDRIVESLFRVSSRLSRSSIFPCSLETEKRSPIELDVQSECIMNSKGCFLSSENILDFGRLLAL